MLSTATLTHRQLHLLELALLSGLGEQNSGNNQSVVRIMDITEVRCPSCSKLRPARITAPTPVSSSFLLHINPATCRLHRGMDDSSWLAGCHLLRSVSCSCLNLWNGVVLGFLISCGAVEDILSLLQSVASYWWVAFPALRALSEGSDWQSRQYLYALGGFTPPHGLASISLSLDFSSTSSSFFCVKKHTQAGSFIVESGLSVSGWGAETVRILSISNAM